MTATGLAADRAPPEIGAAAELERAALCERIDLGRDHADETGMAQVGDEAEAARAADRGALQRSPGGRHADLALQDHALTGLCAQRRAADRDRLTRLHQGGTDMDRQRAVVRRVGGGGAGEGERRRGQREHGYDNRQLGHAQSARPKIGPQGEDLLFRRPECLRG